jgi:transposase
MFLQMVRKRTGEQLDAWLAAVQTSHLEAFESDVPGVQQDKEAVLAGLTLPWSNGPWEGNVNRLNLMKRSRSARAEIDLLKLRGGHHSKKSQERKSEKKKQGHQIGPLKSMKNDKSFLYITAEIIKVA